MLRPLHGWYSLHELELLGQRESLLHGEIDATQMTRLRELLHSDDGSVRASLSFGQRAGCVTVEMDYQVSLELECQRCLEPMREIASRHVSFVLMEDDSLVAGAPAGYEPITLSGERFQPARLIEDEVIVSLPLAPRHARIRECGALAGSLEALAGGDEARSADPSLASH